MTKINTSLVSTLAIACVLSPLSMATADDSNVEKLTNQPALTAVKVDDDSKSSIIKKWGPAPTFKSGDGNFEMKPRGRIYFDAGWLSDKNGTMDISGTEFRTARMGVEGKAWSNIKYKFEADFAGDDVEVKDAYITYVGKGVSVNLGQHKVANSLEESTSSRYTTLMERASFTDAFSFARRIGVSAVTGGDDWTATVGVFKGDNASTSDHDGTEFAGRFTYGPKMGDTQLHFGASTRYRKAGADQSGFRYRQRPHNHLSDRFVNTGALGKKDTLIAAEFAAVNGPLSFQAEYATLTNDMDTVGVDNPTFRGAYGEVSYFFTGGHRVYNAKKGTFDRNKVTEPFSNGGSGAWQLTGRYDMLELNDAVTAGGVQKTVIVGVNWYLNPYMRVMANYSNAKIKSSYNVAANGITGANTVNAFGLRAQIDW